MSDVILPAFSDEGKEATIISWFFQEGDQVKEGDELLEILTDDMTFKIIADFTGVLDHVQFHNGDRVPYLEKLAEINELEE